MRNVGRQNRGLRFCLIAVAICFAAGLVALVARPAVSVESNKAAGADFFGKRIGPFVAKYCGDCHAGEKPERDLDLTKFKDAAAVTGNRKTWRKVLSKLSSHEMPP